jgi:hypothetical protein
MTLQLDILTAFFKNHLKKVFFLIVLLVTTVFQDANAFPDYCSDIASAPPDRVLTGCRFNTVLSASQDASPLAITVVGDVSSPIDAMLSMTPKNPRLFQVGREAIPDDQDEKKGSTSSPGVTKKPTASDGEAAIKPSDTASEPLLQDDHWLYMNIDNEGTYLFFGDMRDADEPLTNLDEEGLLPDGIGIGKRWWF